MSVAAPQTISEGDIRDILLLLESQPVDEQIISNARQTYPQFRFVLCSEDDMYEREPYQVCNHFDVHLIGGGTGAGCASLTQDIYNCAGFVIALHEE